MSDPCDTCKEHEERSRCQQVINRLLQSGNATPGGFMLYPPGIPFPCYSGDCPHIDKTVSIEAYFVVCSCLFCLLPHLVVDSIFMYAQSVPARYYKIVLKPCNCERFK